MSITDDTNTRDELKRHAAEFRRIMGGSSATADALESQLTPEVQVDRPAMREWLEQAAQDDQAARDMDRYADRRLK